MVSYFRCHRYSFGPSCIGQIRFAAHHVAARGRYESPCQRDLQLSADAITGRLSSHCGDTCRLHRRLRRRADSLLTVADRWTVERNGSRDRSCIEPDRFRLNFNLWRPLLPYGYSYKTSCAGPGQAVICNFWHPGTLTLKAERQSARMSKITDDGLTQSGTGCFIAVTVWQQWVKVGDEEKERKLLPLVPSRCWLKTRKTTSERLDIRAGWVPGGTSWEL